MYLCLDFMTEYGNKLPESRFASLLNGFDAGVYPDREEWRMLLTSLSEEQVSRLRRQAARRLRWRVSDMGFMSAD